MRHDRKNNERAYVLLEPELGPVFNIRSFARPEKSNTPAARPVSTSIHQPTPISPGRRHQSLPPPVWATAGVVLGRANQPEQQLQQLSTRNPFREKSQSDVQVRPLRESLQTATETNPFRKNKKQHLDSETNPFRKKIQLDSENQPSTTATHTRQKSPKAKVSPRSKLARSIKRPPPQTHHTQGTAELVSEILAEQTSSVTNQSDPLPVIPNKSSSPNPASRALHRLLSLRSSNRSGRSSSPKPDEPEDSGLPTQGKPDKPGDPSPSAQRKLRKVSVSIPMSEPRSPSSPPPKMAANYWDDMPSPPARHLSTRSAFSNYSARSAHSIRSTHSLDSAPFAKHVSSRSVDASGLRNTHSSSSRPHVSSRRRGKPVADSIDSLDMSFGVPYHHGGPYDATLASVNRNKKYSPLEAVKDSNHEALRATPREYIADSLQKHVPLQGISTIPPGMPDMSGRIMEYEEGADLMREPDAAGGAYKRYDFIPYTDDDLKGKGEPSFTLERILKEEKAHRKALRESNRRGRSSFSGGKSDFEMQNQLRTQSVDPSAHKPTGYVSASTGLQRHDSTGHCIADGLKRRLGSLRRK